MTTDRKPKCRPTGMPPVAGDGDWRIVNVRDRAPMTRHDGRRTEAWSAGTRGQWPHDISVSHPGRRITGRPPSRPKSPRREVHWPASHLRPRRRQPDRRTQPPVRPTHLRIMSGVGAVRRMVGEHPEVQAAVRLHGRPTTPAGVMTDGPCDPLYSTHADEHPSHGATTPVATAAHLGRHEDQDRRAKLALRMRYNGSRHDRETEICCPATSFVGRIKPRQRENGCGTTGSGVCYGHLPATPAPARHLVKHDVSKHSVNSDAPLNWDGVGWLRVWQPWTTPAARQQKLPGDGMQPKFAATSHDRRAHD